MQSKFSSHAFERVSSRLSISHSELIAILDAGSVINIGEENSSNRTHRLFYSEVDKMCFVAIQDMKTGTIVTVLPIDYHQNVSWAVSIESQSQAKSLVIKQDANAYEGVDSPGHRATAFKISAMIVDGYGGYFKTFSLGNWPGEPYKYCVDELIEDQGFVKALAERVIVKLAKIETPIEFLRTISIRLGNNGDPEFFSIYRRQNYFDAEFPELGTPKASSCG